MNFGIKFRLTALGLAVGLMGALIALIMFNSQRQAAELRARLTSVDLESFRIADQFRESLRGLSNGVLRYGIDHDPAIWEACLADSHALDVWITAQQPKLHTQVEKDLLQQMYTAYEDYLRVILNFHARIQSLDQQEASLADFAPVRKESQRLFDLGQTLAKAHYESRNEVLAHANRSLRQLHVS